MNPHYELKRATAVASEAWRARPWTLSLPLLVYGLVKSALMLLSPAVLGKLSRFDFIAVLAVTCTVGSVTDLLSSTASIPARNGVPAPLPSLDRVLSMTGLGNFIAGYAVRLIGYLVIAGSVYLVLVLALSAAHLLPTPEHPNALVDVLTGGVFAFLWWSALSPYLLATPMFAIARGTRNSMFRASWRFTRGSRLMFLGISTVQMMVALAPSAVRNLIRPGLDPHSPFVLWTEAGFTCALSFVRSWFLALYTALAWQVSGMEQATEAAPRAEAGIAKDYGVPGLRL